MNEELETVKKEINRASSALHTLILAYGFNKSPMDRAATILLPNYANQVADMLCTVDEHLDRANCIIKEIGGNE